MFRLSQTWLVEIFQDDSCEIKIWVLDVLTANRISVASRLFLTSYDIYVRTHRHVQIHVHVYI